MTVTSDDLLAAIRDFGPIDTLSLCERVGLSKNTLISRLQGLKRSGLIARREVWIRARRNRLTFWAINPNPTSAGSDPPPAPANLQRGPSITPEDLQWMAYWSLARDVRRRLPPP